MKKTRLKNRSVRRQQDKDKTSDTIHLTNSWSAEKRMSLLKTWRGKQINSLAVNDGRNYAHDTRWYLSAETKSNAVAETRVLMMPADSDFKHVHDHHWRHIRCSKLQEKKGRWACSLYILEKWATMFRLLTSDPRIMLHTELQEHSRPAACHSVFRYCAA